MDDAAGDGTRVDIGDLSGLGDGEIHPCEAGDFDVMVCRVAGQLYAIEDLCSHAETTLSDGRLIGFQIICPLHGAQFDVRDGAHKSPPAYSGVASFPVTENPDGVATVEVPASRPSGPGPDFGDPGGMFRTR